MAARERKRNRPLTVALKEGNKTTITLIIATYRDQTFGRTNGSHPPGREVHEYGDIDSTAPIVARGDHCRHLCRPSGGLRDFNHGFHRRDSEKRWDLYMGARR